MIYCRYVKNFTKTPRNSSSGVALPASGPAETDFLGALLSVQSGGFA